MRWSGTGELHTPPTLRRWIIWYICLNTLTLSVLSNACTLIYWSLKCYLAAVPQGLKHLLPHRHIVSQCLFKHMPTLTFCPMLMRQVSQQWLFQLHWQTCRWHCSRWWSCPVSTLSTVGPCAAGSPRISKGCSHSHLIGPTCRCAASMDMHHDFDAGDVWTDNLSRFQGRALPVFQSNCPSRAAHGDPTHILRCLYMHRSPSLANMDTSHTRH